MKIFYTSDVHGYFLPTDYMDQQPKAMGLLSASKNFQVNEDNLIIDCGDMIQGSVYDYYLMTKSQPEKISAIMNKISYSHIGLGNHDFNYGYDYLKDYVNNLQAKVLCANLVDLKGEIKNLAAYDIVEIQGKKVGLIGACTDFVNIWEQKENLKYFQVKDTLQSLIEAYDHIKDCDFKICIYHGGVDFNIEDYTIEETKGENIASKIASSLDLDLLLTGHQHRQIEDLSYQGTRIIQPGSNGGLYGEITVDLDTKAMDLKLRPVDGDFDREKFQEEIEENALINDFIDQKICQLDKDYLPADRLTMALQGSALADLVNKVQREVSGAQISTTSFANQVLGFSKDLTIRQIINTLRFPNTLLVCQIDGKSLRQYLNKNYQFIVKDGEDFKINPKYLQPKLSLYNFDFLYGLDFQIDYDQDFENRIGKIFYQGREVQDTDSLSLVMNNYRKTGVSGFDMLVDLKVLKEINFDLAQIFIDFFSEKKFYSL
ncbi:MAG: 5'-nucleotidase C-terminal domain-containing protein [Bacillota bacterium]|nr:5'-nucleotidase C-terminal domain-containing protein [Bacillota bacterium]